jgi:flagellar basal body-associated protein FliL
MQQVPTPPQLPDFIVHQGPDPVNIAIAVVIVVASIGSVGILWMLVRGLLRRWAGQAPADAQAIQELKHTVRQLGAEVMELQERLDFAERVLTARKEPERIERGGT